MNKALNFFCLPCTAILTLSACTSAKLEARLEANPQCKDLYNAKIGALMPCPGSERSFYVASGLETPRQAKQAAIGPAVVSAGTTSQTAQILSPQSSPPSQSLLIQVDCKPTIHKKTGSMLPCPPSE